MRLPEIADIEIYMIPTHENGKTVILAGILSMLLERQEHLDQKESNGLLMKKASPVYGSIN
jgi:hypothetical protein